jgi:hypothetical protein
MGKLVEQSIKTLYQGVSRQPDPVRLPGQVEEADNILVSVVTGGFESRPSSRHITELVDYNPASRPAVYSYSRDAVERYIILVENGDLRVYDLDGEEITVNTPDGVGYLTGQQEDFSFVTIADYTIIANRSVTVQMAANSYVTQNRALINCRTTNAQTNYSIQIKRASTGTWQNIWSWNITDAQSNTQLSTHVWNNLSLPSGFSKSKLGDTIIITGNEDFEIRHFGSDPTYGPWSMTDVVAKRDYLPSQAPNGYFIRVGANIDAEDYGYWAEFRDEDGGWAESYNPYEQNAFDLTTMPHFLVRESDGSFTFKQGDYKGRIAGDNETVPPPDFVDNEITSLVFHRNRLAFVASETIFFSQAGKYFTFWPDFSTQSLDSDAFGLTASAETVNELRHAVGFRKSLFLTSNKAQFEVSGSQLLTPSTATVDLSTTYLTEEKCRPITLGNTLYFAAQSGRDALVFEYQYDDTSVSNVASDITLHALGYIPAPIIQMTGDSTNDMLMLLCEDDRSSLYIYKMYVDGGSKAQSAWSKWTYGDDADIKWCSVIDGELYVILTRGDKVFLEKTFLRYELSQQNHPYQVSMDRQQQVTGVYDPVTNLTTWQSNYPTRNKSKVVLSNDFQEGLVGEVLDVDFVGAYGITAVGDFSAGRAIIGETFTSRVRLSKLYPRDPNNLRRTITSGRFQLRNLTLNYKESGFFRIVITPEYRNDRSFQFTGRNIGSGDSRIGIPAISQLGTFKVPIMSRAETVQIEVVNDSEKPMNITSIDYVGFFNELTRQG